MAKSMRNILATIVVPVLGGIVFAPTGALADDRRGLNRNLQREWDEPPIPGCADCRYIWTEGAVAPRTTYRVVGDRPTCSVPPTLFEVIAQGISDVSDAAQALTQTATGDWAGSLKTLWQNDRVQEAIQREAAQHGGEIANAIRRNGRSTRQGNCIEVAAVLPASATVVGYRFIAYDAGGQDGQTRTSCPANGRECGFGWSRFLSPAQTERVGNVQVIGSTFMNWHMDRDREGSIIVAYRIPTTTTVASRPDPNGPALYGSLSLDAGFQPDPRIVDVNAGGSLDARSANSSCSGFVARNPDVRVSYSPGSYPLIISVASSADTTLVVNAPDGQWYCDDDSGSGNNPSLRFGNPQRGRYNIFVGTYRAGAPQAAQLHISEATSQ